MFSDSRTPGRRRPASTPASASSSSSGSSDDEDADHHEPIDASVSEEHRKVAVLLGRTILNGVVHYRPDEAYTQAVLQAMLSGHPVGHKHHDHNIVATWTHVACEVVQQACRLDFSKGPPNLRGVPGCWSAATDGITLQNGTTILPIVIYHTGEDGQMNWFLLDAPLTVRVGQAQGRRQHS